MTLEETKEILKFLRGCYPAFYRNFTPYEFESVLLAWTTLFSDERYTYNLTLKTVKKYVTGRLRTDSSIFGEEISKGDYKRFPPSPGVILNKARGALRNQEYALRLEREMEHRRLLKGE